MTVRVAIKNEKLKEELQQIPKGARGYIIERILLDYLERNGGTLLPLSRSPTVKSSKKTDRDLDEQIKAIQYEQVQEQFDKTATKELRKRLKGDLF